MVRLSPKFNVNLRREGGGWVGFISPTLPQLNVIHHLITQQNNNTQTLGLSLIVLRYIKRCLLYPPFVLKDAKIIVS